MSYAPFCCATIILMQRSIGHEMGIILFKAGVVLTTIILILVAVGTLYEYETVISDGSCNIAVYPLEGVILPYHGLIDAPLISTPEQIEAFLVTAEQEDNIDGVLLEINSPGGTPVASERIAERLRASSLPIIGQIGDMGASGGYMVAAATDYLLASAMSDVGSIGVTMSYLEETEKNEEEGLTYVELSTGKFKDAGSPYKPLTEEERALFERDLEIVHDHFVDLVARYRDLPVEQVAALADGSTMTGQRAVENGLIDAIGGREEARLSFSELLGIDPTDIEFCEYEPTWLTL